MVGVQTERDPDPTHLKNLIGTRTLKKNQIQLQFNLIPLKGFWIWMLRLKPDTDPSPQNKSDSNTNISRTVSVSKLFFER